MFNYEQYEESSKYIKNQMGEINPKIAIILGSGLGVLSEEFEQKSIKKEIDIELNKPKSFNFGTRVHESLRGLE